MESKDLRRVSFYFTSNGGDDYTTVDSVNAKELCFNLVNGNRQRFVEFDTAENGIHGPTTLINLDNVTCIVIGPKKT